MEEERCESTEYFDQMLLEESNCLATTCVLCFNTFAKHFSGCLRGSEPNTEFMLDCSVGKPTQNFLDLKFGMAHVAFTKLISKLLEKVPQFLEDCCHPLWKLMCDQVQWGPSELQQVLCKCQFSQLHRHHFQHSK
jgi:hypothetical protein